VLPCLNSFPALGEFHFIWFETRTPSTRQVLLKSALLAGLFARLLCLAGLLPLLVRLALPTLPRLALAVLGHLNLLNCRNMI
jgi:hypothetical protein